MCLGLGRLGVSRVAALASLLGLPGAPKLAFWRVRYNLIRVQGLGLAFTVQGTGLRAEAFRVKRLRGLIRAEGLPDLG